MESVASSSFSRSASHQEASNYDESFKQQSFLFADDLKDLKNLRKQFHSAAEYFERSYRKDDHKKIMLDTLKHYAMEAFISTVDQLGFMSNQVNHFLDEQVGELLGTELQLSCIEQRLRIYQESVGHEWLSEQSVAIKFPKYRKHYILPAGETISAVDQATSKYHSSSFHADNNLLQCENAAQGATVEIPSSPIRKGHSTLPSPQSSPTSSAFSFRRIASNKELKPGAISRRHFLLIRSKSHVGRSTAQNSSNAKHQYPSEPRRSVSLCTCAEGERRKEIGPHSSKSKRLLKALLSIRMSRKDNASSRNLDESCKDKKQRQETGSN